MTDKEKLENLKNWAAENKKMSQHSLEACREPSCTACLGIQSKIKVYDRIINA